MIMVSLGCAVLAAWLAVPRPAARSLSSRLAPPAPTPVVDARIESRTTRRRSWTVFASLIILLGLIIAAGFLGELRGAVLAGAGVLVAGDGRPIDRVSTDDEDPPSGREADCCARMHRVGVLPSGRSGAICCTGYRGRRLRRPSRRAIESHTLGGDVVSVWRQQARRSGYERSS